MDRLTSGSVQFQGAAIRRVASISLRDFLHVRRIATAVLALAMALIFAPLQIFPVVFAVTFAVVSLLASRWVYVDTRARFAGTRLEALIWSLGTLLALPIFLPIYLIAARPIGRMERCPSCGRPTLMHRAACQHCGNPVAFEPPPVVWGLSEIVGISIVFIFSLPVVAAAAGFGDAPSLAVLSTFAVVQNVLFVGLAVYVTSVRYRLPVAALGLSSRRWPLLLLVGLAIGGLTIFMSMGAERLAIAALTVFVGRERAERMAASEHERDVLMGILRGPLTSTELIWILILVCALVPIGEEVFFRGFVYGALRQWGTLLAAGLSALFFGAVHQQVVHFLPIFVLGVILALLYERTRSLLPTMVVHAVNNLVAILAVIYGWNI